MSLQIIGAGFGRTGTLSLKLALEQLGLGPCYHMHTVFQNAEDAATWEQARIDGNADWPQLLKGYVSAVDWPPAYFWRQLREFAPEAKVILSVRDAESWYKSISSTIFPAQTAPLADNETDMNLLMPRRLIRFSTFDDRCSDKQYVIDTYQRHNQAVIDAVPADQLLVYDITDGWAPLCQFLGLPTPDGPMPRSNTAEDFKQRRLTQAAKTETEKT
ncbi:MAG: sulfotransferase family protein [Gammaproteobacteria bacterium]|nr:MAG: sulfotransferase family protein [Gammaproteobacteria bacterium]RLA16539.1 MAG: sulfotransferase family protein [Gammaproteobacteria bacterium]